MDHYQFKGELNGQYRELGIEQLENGQYKVHWDGFTLGYLQADTRPDGKLTWKSGDPNLADIVQALGAFIESQQR